MADPFKDAFSEVQYGSFLADALRYTYEPQRFKRTARSLMAAIKNKQNAATQEVSDIAQKMKLVGAAAGIPGGPFAIGTNAANIASLMYHLVEMCGVMAEVYGLDTQKSEVKALVLAGASNDFRLMDEAIALVQSGSGTKTPLSKTLVVSILLALQFNLGIKGAIDLTRMIPGLSAVIVAWSNFRTVKNTGRSFSTKLMQIG